MILNLVRKDLLLAKKYLPIIFLAAFIIPIFINNRLGNVDSGFLSFFIMVMYIEYMLFNTVSITESKYKGCALLSVTPYTRNLLVKAKYLLIISIFISCYIVYSILTFFTDINILSISELGTALVLITTFFGILVPLQYKFGYEKTKYIAAFFIFISPFILPTITDFIYNNQINLENIYINPLKYILALVIFLISIKISIVIFQNKNL